MMIADEIFIKTYKSRMETKLIFWIIIWLILWYLISKIYFLIKIKKSGKKSVSKSRSVILGQVNEKIAPILPNFPYNYKDMTFIGKWIDYIVFDGLSNWNLKQIILLEIKSWTSNLNKNERMIKNITDIKRVKYEVYKM